MLTATVAFVLLIVAGVSSIPAVRRTMRYQTWWAVHLYLYLALVLAFAHEIKTGVMFIGHPSRSTSGSRSRPPPSEPSCQYEFSDHSPETFATNCACRA